MRALIVEDDRRIAEQLQVALREAGFAVDLVDNGEDGEHIGSTETFDIVILDLGLPKKDGVSVLKSWRQAGRSMPVLILTARDEWSEKVAGFRAGADDYVVKPFRMEEVVVRARSLVRRAAGHASPVLSCRNLEYDTQTAAFMLDGLPLKLTAFESRILAYMIHHQDRPLSRTELSEHVYDRDTDRDFNSIEVIVGRLRRKIGAAVIETARGQGYILSSGKR